MATSATVKLAMTTTAAAATCTSELSASLTQIIPGMETITITLRKLKFGIKLHSLQKSNILWLVRSSGNVTVVMAKAF